MNPFRFTLLKKLPLIVITSVVALGAGASSLPFATPVSAETNASIAALSPDFSSPAKMELIYLIRTSMDSQGRFAQTSDHREYWTLSEAQNQAMAAIRNPSPSSAELFSAKQSLESAMWTYDSRYIKSKQEVSQILGRTGSWIWTKYPSSDHAYLTPWEKNIIDTIDKTYDLMESMGDSRNEAARAYQYYNLESTKFAYMLKPDFDQNAASFARYQSNVIQPLAELQQSGINMEARVQNFERSVAFMQAVLSNNSYEKPVYDAALNDVSIYSYIIVEAAYLNRTITQAQQVVDTSPKGIRSGEYPASAFGTLNRAINEAKRVLETGKSAEEINNAAYELNYAVGVFKRTVKP